MTTRPSGQPQQQQSNWGAMGATSHGHLLSQEVARSYTLLPHVPALSHY